MLILVQMYNLYYVNINHSQHNIIPQTINNLYNMIIIIFITQNINENIFMIHLQQ